MSNEPTSSMDPQIKAYIDSACQATVTTLIEKVKEIINQQTEAQRSWNEQLQKTIDEWFSKLEQVGLTTNGVNFNNNMATEEEQTNQTTPATICSQSELRDDLPQDNKNERVFRHTAQYKLSRNITTCDPPVLQSVSETLTTQEPQ
ncbi:17374_t:CDS:2 [Dentiscutata erythropus]|uniref:17374_t:CDS:1 n=1 Tax=Dentiscutata erythropus TaxID=1348616 RepID=A0A9N9B9X5_9GLOM|nr:17374_t:CDS:2 [Dentiscutata erythropus]